MYICIYSVSMPRPKDKRKMQIYFSRGLVCSSKANPTSEFIGVQAVSTRRFSFDKLIVLFSFVGTRFRPLSLDIPKPLFPVAGFPMIYHHIEAASQVCMRLIPLKVRFDNDAYQGSLTMPYCSLLTTSKNLQINCPLVGHVDVDIGCNLTELVTSGTQCKCESRENGNRSDCSHVYVYS